MRLSKKEVCNHIGDELFEKGKDTFREIIFVRTSLSKEIPKYKLDSDDYIDRLSELMKTYCRLAYSFYRESRDSLRADRTLSYFSKIDRSGQVERPKKDSIHVNAFLKEVLDAAQQLSTDTKITLEDIVDTVIEIEVTALEQKFRNIRMKEREIADFFGGRFFALALETSRLYHKLESFLDDCDEDEPIDDKKLAEYEKLEKERGAYFQSALGFYIVTGNKEGFDNCKLHLLVSRNKFSKYTGLGKQYAFSVLQLAKKEFQENGAIDRDEEIRILNKVFESQVKLFQKEVENQSNN